MTVLADRPRARLPVSTEAIRDQMMVTSGQLVAGLGNMAFSLLVARLIAPGMFAQFASFLALYLILSMPGSAISAAAALDPVATARARPLLLGGGAVLGLGLIAGSPFIASALRLPVGMVVVLGLSGPVLGTLALERGRLYAWNHRARLVTSLISEPAVRLTLGLALTAATGPVGGAFGVTVAGFAALEIARRHPSMRHHRSSVRAAPLVADEVPPGRISPAAQWTALAFLVLVIVQNQDLLIANRVLPPAQAGQFAVLSTLGGLAVFATMTVPLVLLPRSGRGDGGGLLPALSITALIGAAAVGVTAVIPDELVTTLFGARYREAAGVLVPYMAAMALLGMARVLVAHRCAVGTGRSSVVLVGLTVAIQAGLILAFGHTTRAVAYSTVTAVTGLSVSLGAAELARLPAVRLRARAAVHALTRPVPLLVSFVSLVGLAERFVIPRGLWLDEATSVYEARLPFAQMITTLRTADVHPPLYFSVLWVTIRCFGSGQLAVRLPSIIAGALVVPMLFVLGREVYDRRTGVIAAALGSLAPIMIWYSQEARMYALLMLFGVLALWAQVRIFRGGGRLAWLLYALASVALVWTQYFGAFQVVVQQLAFAFACYSKLRRGEPVRQLVVPWVISSLAIAACLAPLLPFAYQQYVVNQTGGKGFGGPQQVGSATSLSGNHLSIYAALAVLIWGIWGYQPTPVMMLLAALWPLGMLFALVMLGRRHQRATTLLVLAVLGPGVALFALGLVKRDLFDIRYLSTTVPVLFVLLARLLTAIPRRTLALAGVTTLVLMSLAAGLIDQQYNGANPRTYDFNGALASVEAEARPGDVVYYDPVDLNQVVGYYAPHLVLEPLSAQPPPRGNRRMFIVASPSLMNGATNRAALSSFLDDLHNQGRRVVRQSFSNVETWEFR
ncbi:MAG: glycosyltransferase family 39 protein [Acidimicrobiales bacterium]